MEPKWLLLRELSNRQSLQQERIKLLQLQLKDIITVTYGLKVCGCNREVAAIQRVQMYTLISLGT